MKALNTTLIGLMYVIICVHYRRIDCGTGLQSGRSRVLFPMGSLGFFIGL